MKNRSLLFSLIIGASISFIAGCGQAYRLSASGWGSKLSETGTLLEQVGETMNSTAKTRRMLADATARENVLGKLNQAETILRELKSNLPESGPDHHAKLLTGVDELLSAISKGKQGIENKDPKLLKEFNTLSSTAGEKLKEWGDIVQNNE